MKKILLDTNAYTAFMNGVKLVFDHIIDSENIYISTIMAGELFAGFIGGKKYSENIDELKKFLKKDGVITLAVTIETSEIFLEPTALRLSSIMSRIICETVSTPSDVKFVGG